MTTTHTYNASLLGRALMPVPAGALAMVVNHAHTPARGVAAAASAATSTTDAATAHAATGAIWLDGSDFTTVSTNATFSNKRIHPGRLEGMT